MTLSSGVTSSTAASEDVAIGSLVVVASEAVLGDTEIVSTNFMSPLMSLLVFATISVVTVVRLLSAASTASISAERKGKTMKRLFPPRTTKKRGRQFYPYGC